MISGIAIGLLSALGLSILIFVHELGHFLAAKKSGVWVEEFGLGIPPRMFGKKIGETIYSLNWLPIGGFVRLHGETETAEISDPKRAMINVSKKKRAFIAFAGVAMNFLFAIFAFAVVYSVLGIPQDTNTVSVAEVIEDSPAQDAQFTPNDIILSADGEDVSSTQEFITYAIDHAGDEIMVSVQREDGSVETLFVTPRENPPEGEGALGLVVTQQQDVYYPPLWQRPFVGAYYGMIDAFNLTWAIMSALFGSVQQVATGGGAPEGLVGPVGIFALLAYITKLGILPLINFLGVFSLNLAVLNLVPFPPLDGFRLFTIGAEGVFGRKIVPQVEYWLHTVGMVILIGLMLFMTFKEVPKAFKADSLNSFVESIVPLE